MRQLFFCGKNYKTYLLVDEDIRCDVCDALIKIMDIAVIHSKYSKKKAIPKKFTCTRKECIEKFHEELVDVFTTAFVVENIPLGCLAIPEPNVQIGSGNQATVFSVAVSNDGVMADTTQTKVTDHTKLAGRPEGSWQGVSIGKDITKELEEKDKPMLEDDPLNFLKDLQQGTQRAIDMGLNPEVRANEIIEQKKAKAIEDKSDDTKNP